MKIKEVLTEGVLGTLGSMAGAVAGGIGKGLADIVAPGAVDQMKGSLKKQAGYNDLRKTSAYSSAQAEQELTKDPKVKAALDRTMSDVLNLIKQRQATAQTEPAAKSSFDTWSKTTNPNLTQDPTAIKKLKKNNPMFYKKTLGEDSSLAEAETAPLISLVDVQKLLAKNGAPAQGAGYIATRLAASGVRVAGYQPPAGTMSAAVSKDNRIVDVLIQRAKQTGKSSMAEIAKAIPKTGLYADPAKRDAKIKEIANQIAELGISVTGYQLQAQPDQWSWDSKSSTLTLSGQEGTFTYRRFQDGSWRDNYTNEKIPANRAKELQYQFDKLTGRVAFPGGRPKPQGLQPNQVKTNTGEIISKNEQDGKWYRADGTTVITDPKILAWLERKYTQNKQNAQMAATTITNPSVAV
jgi:hypothetical protein